MACGRSSRRRAWGSLTAGRLWVSPLRPREHIQRQAAHHVQIAVWKEVRLQGALPTQISCGCVR